MTIIEFIGGFACGFFWLGYVWPFLMRQWQAFRKWQERRRSSP